MATKDTCIVRYGVKNTKSLISLSGKTIGHKKSRMQVTPENPVAAPTHHSETKCARLTKIMITFCLFPVSYSKEAK